MDSEDPALARALRKADVTREVVLDSGGLARLPSVLKRHFPDASVLIVADRNTLWAAGLRALEHLRTEGLVNAAPLILGGDERRLKPKVDYALEIAEGLQLGGHVPVAVGSGVVNDLVKYGASLVSRPYVCVPTAASMDGYAASGASLLDNGFKRTMSCPPPVAIVADLDVIAAAPAEMAPWGYGDLAGKVVAGMDWVLADALEEEAINREPFALVQENLRSWLEGPSDIAAGDLGGLQRLMSGLLISGFAIQAHGDSRPASGSDHQFAHLWEMEGLEVDGAPASHGACVGVGSVAMLAVYEWLLQQDVPDYAPDRVADHDQDGAWLRQEIDDAFTIPRLRESTWAEARAKQPSPDTLHRRMTRLTVIWPKLRRQLQEMLVSPATMQNWLGAAGAPSHFSDFRITAADFAADHRRARLIRRRYTALDLLADLGWFDDVLGSLFAPDGFWARREVLAAK